MKKEKIVIIGMGFLATYIIPCYKKLLDDAISTNVIGIKGSERGLAEKQAECPFPVIVGRVRETLEEWKPDIILLAVKPNQVAAMTEETLAPYYQMLRESGEKLPDLYSVAPDPTVDYFYDVLGSDVNCANQLPNMISMVEGYDLSKAGVSFVSFDSRREWPEENKQRARNFLEPTGTIVEIDSDKAISFLSLQCACHLMFEMNYIVEDVTAQLGAPVPLAKSASAYRSVFRKHFADPCTAVLPCSAAGVSENLKAFMEVLLDAWYDGVLRFSETENIPHDAADRMICGTIETYHMEAMLEPRETLVRNTNNHATPGGFLEMCMKTFKNGGYDYVTEQLKQWLSGNRDETLYAGIEKIAFGVAKAISDHGKTVSGITKERP